MHPWPICCAVCHASSRLGTALFTGLGGNSCRTCQQLLQHSLQGVGAEVLLTPHRCLQQLHASLLHRVTLQQAAETHMVTPLLLTGALLTHSGRTCE
jgi:hypothetical protein